jgi:hypothetical protein
VLIGKDSTIWSKPPALFALVIFEIVSWVLLRLAWPVILLFYASHSSCIPPYQAFPVDKESHELFCSGCSGTMIVTMSVSQVIRIAELSHCTSLRHRQLFLIWLVAWRQSVPAMFGSCYPSITSFPDFHYLLEFWGYLTTTATISPTGWGSACEDTYTHCAPSLIVFWAAGLQWTSSAQSSMTSALSTTSRGDCSAQILSTVKLSNIILLISKIPDNVKYYSLYPLKTP